MKAEIQAEYERLGHEHGWVFASTPIKTMATAETIFVGLNPGSSDEINAFYDEPRGNSWFIRDAEKA